MKLEEKRMLKRVLIIFCCYGSLFLEAQSLRVQRITQQNMRSFSWEDKDWSDNFNEYLHQCLEALKEGQPFQKRKQAFEVLKDLFVQSNYTSELVMDPITWENLQLFCNSENNIYLGNLINKAVTEFGKVYFLCMIGEPTTDITLLKRRQAIIKELVRNQELYDKVGRLLKVIQHQENNILSLFYKKDPFWQAAQRSFYNIAFAKGFNNSWHALEFKNRFDHYSRFFCLFANIAAAGVLTIHGLRAVFGQSNPQILDNLKNRFEGSGGEMGPLISLLKYMNSTSTSHGALNVLAGFYCSLMIKGQAEWEKDLLFLDHCLQTKLIGIRRYIIGVNSLSSVIKKNAILSDNLVHSLDSFSANKKHKKLFSLLSSATFKGKSSIFSLKGKVLLAYKMTREQKEAFLPSFMTLGELDFYYAVATLFKESEKKEVSYTFAEYVESKKPYVELQDCWNPFINTDKVVSNSVHLGHTYKRNGIVTGPNAGGKSCHLKACSLGLILGQSIGIVPAKTAVFTPFHKIMTHLNITDDITSGNSFFKAEVLRAQYILETIKACKPHQYCFVVMDEIFNGTTPVEGQAAAYSYAQCIGSYENVISLIATHFPRLVELEAVTDYFKNYKVLIEYKENKDVHYTFKVQPGSSNQHIAFDILRMQGFDEEIVTNAQSLIA